MAEIEVKQVIVSNLTKRGQGYKTSPVRKIKEVYDFDGKLIADIDPLEFSIEIIFEFLKWRYKEIPTETHISNIEKYFLEKDED